MHALCREPPAAAEAAPPAIVLVHNHKAQRDKFVIPPAGIAQNPRRMRIRVQPPFLEMGTVQILKRNHADRSFASTCGTMPRSVAGPAVGIEMQTRASFCVAPLNG